MQVEVLAGASRHSGLWGAGCYFQPVGSVPTGLLSSLRVHKSPPQGDLSTFAPDKHQDQNLVIITSIDYCFPFLSSKHRGTVQKC